MNKLVCVIIGQNCERFIEMVLESVKDADAIVYCDGGSTDNTLDYLKTLPIEKITNTSVSSTEIQRFYEDDGGMSAMNHRWNIIRNKYNQEDLGMNGKQRNFYLNYLKQNFPNDWCLALDADEVLEDFGIQKIKSMLTSLQENMLISPRIHHFVGDLGHEDATKEQHFVPNRLFKIKNTLFYPEVEHPILQSNEQFNHGVIDIHIYHLRECLGIFETRKKHINNWKKSNIHFPDYLNWWNNSMILGNYPRKAIYYGQIPTPIKQHFNLFRDILIGKK